MPEILLRRASSRRATRTPSTRTPDHGAADLRAAAITTFAYAGFATASWAVRIPDIAGQVGAGHGALGGALLCLSLGALATMRLTGGLVERLGAGRTTAVALLLVALTTVLPGLAGSVRGLGLALLVFGAATGALNVAMNSVGIRLESALDRPALPSLHAAFSFGGLGGSLVGGVAAGVAAPATHLLLVGLSGVLVAAGVAARLAAGDDPAARSVTGPASPADQETAERPTTAGAASPHSLRTTLVALGVIAGCTAFAEGALGDWAALHLAEDLQASTTMAAAGYAAFSLAMACGRLAGRSLLLRWGGTRLLVLGPLVAAAGMVLGAWSTNLWTALGGLVVVGLGLANVFPVAIGRAGAVGGSRGVGLASTVGYTGMLGGPALIGFLAAYVGLPAALSSVSVAAVVAAALALTVARVPAVPRARLLLPWGPGEVAARLRSAVGPVGNVARGHGDSLGLLVPDHAPRRSRAGSDVSSVFSAQTMLGRD